MRRILIIRFLNKINVAKYMATHLVGKKHTPTHHKICGLIVMACGVTIAKMTAIVSIQFIHYIGDGLGYAIHGIGCIPFISLLEEEPEG